MKTVEPALVYLLIDDGGNRDRAGARGLRDDPPADRLQGLPFGVVEEQVLFGVNCEAAADHLARLAIPGRGGALRQHVVARIEVTHAGDPARASARPARPMRARKS